MTKIIFSEKNYLCDLGYNLGADGYLWLLSLSFWNTFPYGYTL